MIDGSFVDVQSFLIFLFLPIKHNDVVFLKVKGSKVLFHYNSLTNKISMNRQKNSK